jgi:hypothetical protein
MAYPQQPYGQQPNLPPGAPGPGGYQQQGQFPPGPGQHLPPGGPYSGGPWPPKKSNTGLVVGISVAVVALLVFTITAFVAPGFLLGDKDSGGTAASASDDGGNSGTDPGCGKGGGSDDDGGVVDGSAQKLNAVVSKIVQGFCDKDQDGLKQLVCSGSEPAIMGYITEAEHVEEFELQGEIDDAGPTATAKARAVLADGAQRVEATMIITLAYEGEDFCWKDMEEV